MDHPDLVYCRSRLKDSAVSCAAVAQATGLSKRWVEYVRDGTVDNPGVKNLMALKSYLQDLGHPPDRRPEPASVGGR